MITPALIVLEATGGIDRSAVRALVAAERPVTVATPREVRDFANATGQWAKTDVLDAQILARFAEAGRPGLRPVLDEMTAALRALITRRRQLIDRLTAETNRVSRAARQVQKRIKAHLRWRQAELQRVEVDLDHTIRHRPLWREQEDMLKSVPGIGPVVTQHPAGRAARPGPREPQTRCRAGRSGATELGQRPAARSPRHVGRSRSRPHGSLHGGVGGQQAQSRDPRLLQTAACSRK